MKNYHCFANHLLSSIVLLCMQLPINLSKGKRMSLIETAKVEKALALCQDAEYEVQHLNKEKMKR